MAKVIDTHIISFKQINSCCDFAQFLIHKLFGMNTAPVFTQNFFVFYDTGSDWYVKREPIVSGNNPLARIVKITSDSDSNFSYDRISSYIQEIS